MHSTSLTLTFYGKKLACVGVISGRMATWRSPLSVKSKSWQGAVLNFELSAKMAMLSTPITGTVEVTDTDVIINADLGMLNRFVSDETAAEMFGKRFKGLLN